MGEIATMGLVALALALSWPAAAGSFSLEFKNRYAEVDISWSAEANAVPALAKRFRTDFAREKNKSIACGKTESDARISTGGQGIACSSSTKITTSGQTIRLLSLSRKYWAFTGGAHGNGGTSPLLWDRKVNREVPFASLFLSASTIQAVLGKPYCIALDKERAKRRGPDYGAASIAEFVTCPKLADLALVPAGPPSGGKFTEIHLIAAPYQAGSYAEGEYDIALPITPRLIGAIKPAYRMSFAAQRQ
jgi:hypothetical protein